jgi:hypothetical protein
LQAVSEAKQGSRCAQSGAETGNPAYSRDSSVAQTLVLLLQARGEKVVCDCGLGQALVIDHIRADAGAAVVVIDHGRAVHA